MYFLYIIVTALLFAFFSVRQKSDLEDESTTFHPDMTHQLFGEQ